MQLVGGLALAALAIWTGRWPAAVMIVIALRMLVDPTTHSYYDAGLIIGAAIFDLAVGSKVVPWATVWVLALVYLPSYVLAIHPDARGVARTIALATIVIVGLVQAPRARPGRRTGPPDD